MTTPALPDVRTLSRLASRVLGEWYEGRSPPDTLAALERFPELRGNLGLVEDLVYEEFLQRRGAGEQIDVCAFAARFPELEDRLRTALTFDQGLAEHPGALRRPVASGLVGVEARRGVPWPVPGETVGGCTLLRELGRGAFARVYLAVEASAGDRPVALKVSAAETGGAEARTLGRLHHEHIVPIYWSEQDPASGLTLTCMPFLGSATLDHVLRGLYPPSVPPRPPARATALLAAVRAANWPGELAPDVLLPGPALTRLSFAEGVACLAVALLEALDFLHARGLYHCDLKPSNVLLTPLGRPLLLDFNLSRRAGAPGGRFGGTVPYMAPELLRALQAEAPFPAETAARADLYSLGVLLFELLTGGHPFGAPPEGTPEKELPGWYLGAIGRGMAPLTKLRPDLPAALAREIDRCLSPDPWRRPASAAEMAEALRAQPARRPGGRLAVAGLGGLLLFAAAMALPWGGDRPAPRPPGPAPAPAPVEEVALHRAAGLAALNQACWLREAGPAARAEKELRAAAAGFRTALELQAGLPEPLPGAWRDHLGRGRVLLMLGEPAQARGHLTRADEVWRVEMARLAGLAVAGGAGSVGLGRLGSLWACAEPDWQGQYPLRAYQAYCWTWMGNHKEALALGRLVLARGCRAPALLNNLGLSALRTDNLPEAMRFFDEALRRAPNLAAALYNRCQVPLRQRMAGRGPVPRWALADIDRVVALAEQHPGHEPTEVYRVAAKLHALGAVDARRAGDANEDGRRVEKAKEYLVRGCTLGLDVDQQFRDPHLHEALGGWLAPDKLQGRQLRPAVAVVPAYLVDPLSAQGGVGVGCYNPFAPRPRR